MFNFGSKRDTVTRFLPLDSEEALKAASLHSEREPVVLFKHSRLCSLSAMVRERLLGMVEDGTPPIYELVIQASRALSRTIETETGIRHESPQVIVLFKSVPVFNTSHGRIQPQKLHEAVADAYRLASLPKS